MFITIDTEYSAGLARRARGEGRAENFARSISCETPRGPVGIFYQMDVFERHGLKAVFFVDPMPALLWGVEAIADIVGRIVERGHDVQLHVHAEWLALARSANPLGKRTGRNLNEFTFDDQCVLLDYARNTLIAAGAPPPVAFRAGNYGANDDTLRALAEIGMRYDTSHVPGIAESACQISLGPDVRSPVQHCGVIEVPVGCIATLGGGLRHAQLTSLSAAEILAATQLAYQHGVGGFTIVSHSFELMCRDRKQANRIVRARFERLCQGIELIPGLRARTYRDDPPSLQPAKLPNGDGVAVLQPRVMRTARRLAEQVLSNSLYGAG